MNRTCSLTSEAESARSHGAVHLAPAARRQVAPMGCGMRFVGDTNGCAQEPPTVCPALNQCPHTVQNLSQHQTLLLLHGGLSCLCSQHTRRTACARSVTKPAGGARQRRAGCA